MKPMSQGLIMTVSTCAKSQNCVARVDYAEDSNEWRKLGLGTTSSELGNRLRNAAKAFTVAGEVRVVHTASCDGFFQVKLFIKTSSVPTQQTWHQATEALGPFLLQNSYWFSHTPKLDHDGIVSATQGVGPDWPPLDNICIPQWWLGGGAFSTVHMSPSEQTWPPRTWQLMHASCARIGVRQPWLCTTAQHSLAS